MRQNGSLVAHNDHGGEKTRLEQGFSNRRTRGYLCRVLVLTVSKQDFHGTSMKHHAYDRRAEAPWQSRGRIARYCGGFEIHCPLDAGVQIPLSALS